MMLIVWKQLCPLLVLLLGLTSRCVQGECSVEHCTDPSTCVISKDALSCKCATGYYGDHCNKSADIRIICAKDSITIRALEDFFNYYNVPLDSLRSPNKTCRAHKEVINGVVYYASKVTKGQYEACGGLPLEKNITHVKYSLRLQSDPQVIGNIIRDPVLKIKYQCVYPYVRRVSLSFPIVPFVSEIVMRVDELDATVDFLLYQEQTYTTAFLQAPTIELGDKVYVEVSVTEPLDFFLLRINDCWATQYPQHNSTKGAVHHLLVNGCVKDETIAFHNVSADQSGHNGHSSIVRYSFDMFRFPKEPNNVYLHCMVQLCDVEDPASCKPNCNSVRKREAVAEAVRADLNQGLVSYGPIKIQMPDRAQTSVMTTVMLPVAAVWTVGFFLVLLITVVKAGNRRLARAEQ